jgi:hypothetical protein
MNAVPPSHQEPLELEPPLDVVAPDAVPPVLAVAPDEVAVPPLLDVPAVVVPPSELVACEELELPHATSAAMELMTAPAPSPLRFPARLSIISGVPLPGREATLFVIVAVVLAYALPPGPPSPSTSEGRPPSLHVEGPELLPPPARAHA